MLDEIPLYLGVMVGTVLERMNWMSSLAATHMMITNLRQGVGCIHQGITLRSYVYL